MTRNPIWNYFIKTSPRTEARCHKCKAILKTPTGTTTTLAMHLMRHPDSHKPYLDKHHARGCATNLKQAIGNPRAHPSAADSFKPKMKASALKAQQMTKMIGCFIAHGMHSNNVVKEAGFLDLINCAMPDYVVPSRTTFSRAVIPQLYEGGKEACKEGRRQVLQLLLPEDLAAPGYSRWAAVRLRMIRAGAVVPTAK